MVGSIVLTTNQGLGILAHDFYRNGLIDRVLIKHHSSRKNHYDWYPDDDRVSSMNDLLDRLDTLFCIETPFYSEIVTEAKRRGIKTVLMPMYECTTDAVARQFDIIINPSDLDQEVFPSGVRINVPVSVKWKQRKEARVFIHNAGNGGLGGRNGTEELLEAMQYVKSPIQLIIRSQSNVFKSDDPRVTIVNDTVPYADLFKTGDVFIFPEKFNGLSLPLQEAYASGMAVMATDRFPNYTYLPRDILIPVASYQQDMLARPVKIAIIDPKDIATKIDEVYGKDISSLSKLGKRYREKNSWEQLRNQYETVLA